MKDKTIEVQERYLEEINFSDFEEMEEIVTPGFFGFFGCCNDVTW